MTSIDRRTFLGALGFAATTIVSACGGESDEGAAGTTTTAAPVGPTPAPAWSGPAEPFALGVASGDPLADRVMLWTRVVADPLVVGGGIGSDDVELAYDVATDEDFRSLVASGTTTATSQHAHSVYLDVTGLQPDTWYWYRFRVGEIVSSVGRTRTLPAPGSPTEQFRFVFASCQDFQWGHYGAWANAANEDALDAVVFLGDYVYEYSLPDLSPDRTGKRVWANEAAFTLDDYRVRYGQTKSDPSLRAAHERVPWIITWDDHEVSDNYAGDVTKGVDDPTAGHARRLAAHQAWWEHTPIRLDEVPTTFDDVEIYRSFEIGDLASIFVIETRDHADVAPCRAPATEGASTLSITDDGPSCEARFDESRSNLGAAQEAWLTESVTASNTIWNVLANPTMLAGLNIGTVDAPQYTRDMWDGYVAARTRVLAAFADERVSNPVVVTGDWHASYILDVIADGTDEPLMPEFLVTSITSVVFAQDYRAANPHVRYFEPRNGYAVLTLTPEACRCDFRYVDDVWNPDATIDATSSWVVKAGERVPTEVRA